MTPNLQEKTDRYESLLDEALEAATVADDGGPSEHAANGPPEQAPGGEACIEMAASYLEDGRHFRENDDLVNALAAFSYGHGWLDAGARLGALDVPSEGHLFTQ